MASIGYSENQRSAVDVALQAWYDNLNCKRAKRIWFTGSYIGTERR